MSSLHPTPEAAFARGRLLQSQHRLQDAIACYKQALEIDGDHTPSYIMLALCWMENEQTAPYSVDAAQRAVALEPQNAFARSVYALALRSTAKEGQTAPVKEALKHAEEAVGLEPDSDFSHAVLAQIHLRLRDYPKAEASARAALALDTENTMAAQVLSAALLLQKKDADNKDLIDYQLQRNAEDDQAHTSAGWMAVMQGDHKKANHHFLEALRLNPMSENARMGLIESFRARSWFYSGYLRFCHWMNQFTEGKQNAIMIGGFIGYKVLSGYLQNVAPFAANLLIATWLLFALWSHLARGLSTFFVAMDRFARQSLRTREYWEGVIVGGLLFVALGVLVLGYAWDLPRSGFAALACVFAAVANAAAFTNDHHIGRHIYALAAAAAGASAAYCIAAVFMGASSAQFFSVAMIAIMTGVIVSWLRPFRVLYA